MAGSILRDEPLETELPVDVQVALGRLLGEEPVSTLQAWALALREALGRGGIPPDALCFSSEETPHQAVVDGNEKQYFACFYDAVILAAIVDKPVDIRTESPEGEEVVAQAIGSKELLVDPPNSVFSFGIDRHVQAPDGDGPGVAYGYEVICPYVRAFSAPENYLEWAETVPAATVAMPLAGATDLAALLAAE